MGNLLLVCFILVVGLPAAYFGGKLFDKFAAWYLRRGR